jgi:hypothetical protein
VITSAYAFAVNAANLSFYFNTLSTPYFDNSETSSALTVTAVTVVPRLIQKLLLSFPSADSAYINIDIRF